MSNKLNVSLQVDLKLMVTCTCGKQLEYETTCMNEIKVKPCEHCTKAAYVDGQMNPLKKEETEIKERDVMEAKALNDML